MSYWCDRCRAIGNRIQMDNILKQAEIARCFTTIASLRGVVEAARDERERISRAVWTTALTLAHNILIQESDRMNAADEPLAAVYALTAAAKLIARHLDDSDLDVSEMVSEATGLSRLDGGEGEKCEECGDAGKVMDMSFRYDEPLRPCPACAPCETCGDDPEGVVRLDTDSEGNTRQYGPFECPACAKCETCGGTQLVPSPPPLRSMRPCPACAKGGQP